METWYIMEDGSAGDPREIALSDDGILRHKDGRAVAYAPHGPRSRGVAPEAEHAKAAAEAEAAAKRAAADKAKKDAEDAAADAAKKKPAPKAAAEAEGREAKSPEDRELKAKDGETR